MRNDRQSKILAIIALCISVLGITLGFASFSNTLKISSSAIVKPEKKDFFLKAYGLEDSATDKDLWTFEPYTLENLSKPITYQSSATDAQIESSLDEEGKNRIKISNLHVTWTEPNQSVEYWFMIKNEGKYDAYLLQSEFDKLFNIRDSIVCTAVDGTNNEMVQNACEAMNIEVSAQSSDQMTRLSQYGNEGENFIKINKYVSENNFDYLTIVVQLDYMDGGDIADGDFNVKFPDINLEFTSAPPSS